jgi:hypothetical protein
MQFIQRGTGYINVNRIVRIDPIDSGYNVVWLNEHNKMESFHLNSDNAEVLQYLLST